MSFVTSLVSDVVVMGERFMSHKSKSNGITCVPASDNGEYSESLVTTTLQGNLLGIIKIVFLICIYEQITSHLMLSTLDIPYICRLSFFNYLIIFGVLQSLLLRPLLFNTNVNERSCFSLF